MLSLERKIKLQSLIDRYQNYKINGNLWDLLELSPDCQQNDLLKKRKEISILTHSDMLIGEDKLLIKTAEEILQILNGTGWTIEGIKKTMRQFRPVNMENKSQTSFIEQYRNEKIEVLRKMVKLPIRWSDDRFSARMNYLESMVNLKINDINSANTIQVIDILYEKAIKAIKEEFKKIKEKYYEVYNIVDIDEKINLNYDVTLDEFISQLVQIKSGYSLTEIIRDKLAAENWQYISYVGYSSLAKIINAEIHQISQECVLEKNFYNKTKSEQSDYINNVINQQIKKFNDRVTTIFQEYFAIKQKIDSLGPKIYSIDDDELTQKYQLLTKKLTNIDSLGAINDLVEEIETLIQQKRLFNEQELKEVVDSVVKKIGLILASDKYPFTRKSSLIVLLNNLMETLDRWIDEKDTMAITLAIFLNKLDFATDFVNASLKYLFVFFSKSHIYLDKADLNYSEYEGSFYFIEPIDKETLQVYEINNGKVISITNKTIDELYSHFLPLEKVMNSMHKTEKRTSLESDTSSDIHFYDKNMDYYFYSYFNSYLGMPLIGVKEGNVIVKQIDSKYSSNYFDDDSYRNKDEFIKRIVAEVEYIIDDYKQNQKYRNGIAR